MRWVMGFRNWKLFQYSRQIRCNGFQLHKLCGLSQHDLHGAYRVAEAFGGVVGRAGAVDFEGVVGRAGAAGGDFGGVSGLATLALGPVCARIMRLSSY